MTYQSYQSASQPNSHVGYRRICSPLTIETSHQIPIESSPRRNSASAVVLPQNINEISALPLLNFIPPSPQQSITTANDKRLAERQWRLPLFLYSCRKTLLGTALLNSNDQNLSGVSSDIYVDCTKVENENVNLIRTDPHSNFIASSQKHRKRGLPSDHRTNHEILLVFFSENSRRHDEEMSGQKEKQIDEMRYTYDYAFATGRFFTFVQ